VTDNKTEQPSPRRLRQARERGDVPISTALVNSAALLAALLLLPSASVMVAQFALQLIRRAASGHATPLNELITGGLVTCLPLLAGASAAACAVGALQTGAAFSPTRLTPKWENLDLVAGFARLFQLERFTQLARALVAAVAVLWLTSRVATEVTASLAATVGRPEAALHLIEHGVDRLLWQAALLTVALAILDVIITRSQWIRRNRMTKDEVKREHRESEGDPHQKQERRRAHQELLNQATLFSLKDADVLIINPTHIAVGVRYDEALDEAPRVVAYGEEHLARQMIDAARAYGIPIVRDVPVARALREMAIGDEIPEELYAAVAEILRALWEEEQPRDPSPDTERR
jgi:type III secretion protein U